MTLNILIVVRLQGLLVCLALPYQLKLRKICECQCYSGCFIVLFVQNIYCKTNVFSVYDEQALENLREPFLETFN